MRRKILVGLMVVLCAGLLLALPVEAFKLPGVSIGKYYPEFGRINEQIAEVNRRWGTNLEFRDGAIYGLYAEDLISINWKSRVEVLFFQSGISAKVTLTDYPEPGYCKEIDGNLNLTLMPCTINWVYKILPASSICPYLGLGGGLFISMLDARSKEKTYSGENLVDEYFGRDHMSTANIGFIGSVGLQYSVGKGRVLLIEASYLSSKADFKEPLGDLGRPSVDWSGLCYKVGLKINI